MPAGEEGERMLRVIVIGSPGAGKSTFARKLRNAAGLPLYYLDMIWHRPDQTSLTPKQFDLRLHEILMKDRWIIDGNYLRTLAVRLQECDTVFLFDLPPTISLAGARARIGKKREDLPWIESETDRDFEQSILDFPRNQLPQIRELLQKHRHQKDIIIFKSRKEADSYLTVTFPIPQRF